MLFKIWFHYLLKSLLNIFLNQFLSLNLVSFTSNERINNLRAQNFSLHLEVMNVGILVKTTWIQNPCYRHSL